MGNFVKSNVLSKMDFSVVAKAAAKKKVKFSDKVEIIGYSHANEKCDQDIDTEGQTLEHESKIILHWSKFMKDNTATNDTSEESDDEYDNTWIEETYIFDQVAYKSVIKERITKANKEWKIL